MITIQPESQENIIVGKALEHITADDYNNILIPKIKEVLTQHDKINVVVEIDDSFKGWETEALSVAFSFACKEHEHLNRVAIVGAPFWLKGISTFLASTQGKDLHHFERGSLQEALAWVQKK